VYLKLYIFALVKIALLVWAPPYLAGLIAGFSGRKTVPRFPIFVAVGYVLIIELAVLLDKGAPFFWSNIYFMFSLSPIVPVQYALGIGGSIAWMAFATGFVKKGMQRGTSFRKYRKTAEKPAES
jgi:hypothetical protein